ncbi:MAG: sulfotransferase [Bacteroidales bacterium]|nr:sulfotransferase [Bacteroidales bacterium]
MDKQKIIYIAGLGHSGSTILDMILGSHSKIIGLGEIMPFLRRTDHSSDYNSTCSCGKKGKNCDFWAPVENLIKNTNTYNEAYFKITNYFFGKYKNDKILVDSSKNSYQYLKKINELYDLKVIYLTRDYRSWTYSRHLSKKSPVVYWYLRWFLENKKIEYQLKKMNIQWFNVGYEELALYPEHSIKKICNYIEVNFEAEMLNPGNTKSHIINGNVVRADSEKRSKIMYDARWMTSAKTTFWSSFFYLFNKFNKKRVYFNVLGKNLNPSDFFMFSTKRRKEINKKVN